MPAERTRWSQSSRRMSAAGVSPFGTATAVRQLPQRVRPERVGAFQVSLGRLSYQRLAFPASKGRPTERCNRIQVSRETELPTNVGALDGFDVVHRVTEQIDEFDPNSEVVVRAIDDVADFAAQLNRDVDGRAFELFARYTEYPHSGSRRRDVRNPTSPPVSGGVVLKPEPHHPIDWVPRQRPPQLAWLDVDGCCVGRFELLDQPVHPVECPFWGRASGHCFSTSPFT